MPSARDSDAAMTPADCLEQLPRLELDPAGPRGDDELKRAELQQSVLTIADLTHVSETAQVRSLVRHLLGKLPGFDE